MKILHIESQIREQAQKDGITHFSTGIAAVKDGKVLMVRRAVDDFLGGNYELPGGGVDEGENFETAAIREMKEETGLEVVAIIGMFDGFDYSTDRKPKVRQINFLVETNSNDIVLSSEHDAFAWVGPNDVAGLPMSEKMRACMENIFEQYPDKFSI